MKKTVSLPIMVIFTGLAALFAAVTIFRPLMPVDETRYLTVAWEMRLQGNWILPTLNFEPYSHKPPLLFWLIRLMWEIFGVHIWPARVVSFAVMAGLITLTGKLARTLVPDKEGIGMQSMLLITAMPLFLIYGSVVRFDSLLGLSVAAAMLVVWRLSQGAAWRWWLVFGACIGVGILTKGPVALVYMLPPALLAPLWTRAAWGKWYGGVLSAIGVGAIIGLAWAIPAAALGGPDYMRKIFITQSAGRMVNAFDHREAVWFYGPALIGFLLPLLMLPALWSGARTRLHDLKKQQAVRFLIFWIVPVVLIFTLINSKQIHYMIPILPGLAVLAAIVLHGTGMKKAYLNLTISAFLLVIVAHAGLGQKFLPLFDMAPAKAAIDLYKDRPLAAAPKYDGEYGFVMRMEKPINSIGREDIADWFAKNPDGVVIVRYKNDDVLKPYKILFTQRFRQREYLSLIERQR